MQGRVAGVTVVQDARPGQAAKVDALVQECLDAEETILLNGIVLCETVWVLESAYGHSRSVVGEVLEKILLTRQLEVEDRDAVWKRVEAFLDHLNETLYATEKGFGDEQLVKIAVTNIGEAGSQNNIRTGDQLGRVVERRQGQVQAALVLAPPLPRVALAEMAPEQIEPQVGPVDRQQQVGRRLDRLGSPANS